MMKFFKISILIAIMGLILSFYIGGINALYVTTLLVVLEISLSFDNAVVNAKILKDMDQIWQKRFITFGLPIAVFGMRFIFPIIIVAVASNLGIYETFHLALDKPQEYHSILNSVDKIIYAFGGSFLFMVFLSFLFEEEREDYWIKKIESSPIIKKAGELNSIEMMIATLIGLLLIYLTSNSSIALAYFSGVALYSFIASLDTVLNTNGVRNGIMGLLYLEILDASFSFDGVIGAFALSSNVFIIMIGLGIGAMFVRSLTLYLVEQNTLTEYKYLEHGANYAILALALIMFLKIFIHIDEIIVGTIGVSFILISIYSSILENRKENQLLQARTN